MDRLYTLKIKYINYLNFCVFLVKNIKYINDKYYKRDIFFFYKHTFFESLTL